MRILALLLAVITIACGDTVINNSPTGPSGLVDNKPVSNKIEFRVFGNATSARIRFSTPVDGTTQVITGLPYIALFQTSQPSMFLSIEVTPINFATLTLNPFMSAQIIVNGVLFREATSSELSLYTLAASGTWRLNPVLIK